MKFWIPMRITNDVEVIGKDVFEKDLIQEVTLPEGCVGIIYGFKTKKAAYKFYKTKDIQFMKMKEEK